MSTKFHGDAGDLREAADIEERTEGSQTTITSLRRGADSIEALEARLQLAERVVVVTRKLEYEIDQTYDVDGGKPNYPFGLVVEWQAVKTALAAHDKETGA